jgi:hypothetical protein
MPFRVAIRDHGEYVHFYVAKMDTMDGSALVLMANKEELNADPEFFHSLKNAMSAHVRTVVRETMGIEMDDWKEQAAPDSERPV